MLHPNPDTHTALKGVVMFVNVKSTQSVLEVKAGWGQNKKLVNKANQIQRG